MPRDRKGKKAQPEKEPEHPRVPEPEPAPVPQVEAPQPASQTPPSPEPVKPGLPGIVKIILAGIGVFGGLLLVGIIALAIVFMLAEGDGYETPIYGPEPFPDFGCGDGTCSSDENECTCAKDCGECGGGTASLACATYACDSSDACVKTSTPNCCGNLVCEPKESPFNCEVDCPKAVYEGMSKKCNDFVCDAYESSDNCCVDCGCPESYNCVSNTCVKCGDGDCTTAVESKASCCKDCGCNQGYECLGNTCHPVDASNYRVQTQTLSEFERRYAADAVPRAFSFNYEGDVYSITLDISDTAYLFYQDRQRGRDYDLYASDPYDDAIISRLATAFKTIGETLPDSGYAPVGLAVSFVQSLPYTSDKVTTGYDDYARFPYETLHDDGGDCEDTSLLMAAVLKEMGYGVVLVDLPGHVAVGVKCDGSQGTYYEYEGSKYCYLETTGEGWDIGDMPPDYSSASAEIIPIRKRPYISIESLSWKAACKGSVCSLDEEVEIINLGSETPQAGKVRTIIELPDGKVYTWSDDDLKPLAPEDGYTFTKTIKVPSTMFRVKVLAYGNGFVSEEVVTEWADW